MKRNCIVVHHTGVEGLRAFLRACPKGQVPYHFLFDAAGGKFRIRRGVSVLKRCIPEVCRNLRDVAIHVGFLGDYNKRDAERRLYDASGYFIAVLSYVFSIPVDRIIRHCDMPGAPSGITCPGVRFDMGRLVTSVIGHYRDIESRNRGGL